MGLTHCTNLGHMSILAWWMPSITAREMEYADCMGLGHMPTCLRIKLIQSTGTECGRGRCSKKNQVVVTRIKRIYVRQAETMAVSGFTWYFFNSELYYTLLTVDILPLNHKFFAKKDCLFFSFQHHSHLFPHNR